MQSAAADEKERRSGAKFTIQFSRLHKSWRKIGALVAQWDLLNLHSLSLALARSLARWPDPLTLHLRACGENVFVMHASQGVRVKWIALFLPAFTRLRWRVNDP
jgi:hypothetical protein